MGVPELSGYDREQLDGTNGQLAEETSGSDRKTDLVPLLSSASVDLYSCVSSVLCVSFFLQ